MTSLRVSRSTLNLSRLALIASGCLLLPGAAETQAQHLPLESTDRLHLHNKETPSKYESYVDLVPGEWTKIRIEVDGERARLYVHSNEQPTLMVNDVNRAQTRTAAWHCGLNQEPWLTSGI